MLNSHSCRYRLVRCQKLLMVPSKCCNKSGIVKAHYAKDKTFKIQWDWRTVHFRLRTFVAMLITVDGVPVVRGGHASENKEVEENMPGRIASEWTCSDVQARAQSPEKPKPSLSPWSLVQSFKWPRAWASSLSSLKPGLQALACIDLFIYLFFTIFGFKNIRKLDILLENVNTTGILCIDLFIYLFFTFLGSKTYLKLDILLENVYVPFEFYVYKQ